MKTPAAERRRQNEERRVNSWKSAAESAGTSCGMRAAIGRRAPSPRSDFDMLVDEGKMDEAFFDVFLAAYVAEFNNPENA